MPDWSALKDPDEEVDDEAAAEALAAEARALRDTYIEKANRGGIND
jgi:hypothetical protein